MDFTKHSGRARCAVAAGTLVAVLGTTAFAGGAAFAATTPTVGSTVGGLVNGVTAGATTGAVTGAVTATTGAVTGTVNGVTGGIGAGVTGVTGTLLNGTPITATVPVTISTGTILDRSRTTSSTGSTSTTTNGPTTSNSTTSTTGSTSNGSNNSNSSNSSNNSTNSNSANTSSSTGGTQSTTTNSNSSTDSSNRSSTTSTTSTGPLSQVQLTRSASTVYPSKDGYGDDITFDVRPLDKDGNRVAVTGKAYLVLNGTIVKTYDIDANTTTITWDGLVDGKIVPGTYSFVLDVVSANGEAAKSTSKFSVSGKKLSTTTFVQTRRLKAGVTSFGLPKSIKKALAYGTVSVSAKVKHAAHPTVKVTVKRAGKDRVLVVKNGKVLSKKVILPALSKSVKIVLPKRSAKVRTVAVTYRYSKLG